MQKSEIAKKLDALDAAFGSIGGGAGDQKVSQTVNNIDDDFSKVQSLAERGIEILRRHGYEKGGSGVNDDDFDKRFQPIFSKITHKLCNLIIQ